jgi:serine/threonine protein kinase
VHRDFKPCNLLVDHSGRVKITDLGVAAELDSSMVKCTTFVGTFLYMSPERFGSEPHSFPSHIWNVCVCVCVRVCACVCVCIYMHVCMYVCIHRSEPYSFPSDIWSFGLSMMECATGEYPYARGGGGKTYWELMDAIVRNDAPSLTDPGFTDAFKTFLDLCLVKEPKDRARASSLLSHELITSTCRYICMYMYIYIYTYTYA